MARALEAPAPPHALAAFRVMFGLIMAVAAARYVMMGWVDTILVAPTYHFTYANFRWVEPLGGHLGVTLHLGVIGASALALALGVRARLAAGIFFVAFTWLELIEKAAYLNHYYLVSLLAVLLMVVRTDQVFALLPERSSNDTQNRTRWRDYWLFRGQMILVYGFASFAKINGDWLLRGEPLHTWLQAHQGIPVIGSWLVLPEVAIAMSWGGMLFDGTVWLFLLYPRTRPWAFAVALFFHLTVWALFPIGMFSFVMLASLTLFFAPDWPAKLTGKHVDIASVSSVEASYDRFRHKLGNLFLVCWLGAQALIPLRFLAYPGWVNWTEEGFRFSWRVMLIEKTGRLEYTLVNPADGRRWRIYPRHHLTPLQHKMLVTQPDMILEFAHELARQHREQHGYTPEVYAESFVSLDGRPAQRMIDPQVDLASEPLDTFAHRAWILPLKERE